MVAVCTLLQGWAEREPGAFGLCFVGCFLVDRVGRPTDN